VLKNPTRFAAFAAVGMHDPKQAAEELTRCMAQKKGSVGVLLDDFQSSGPGGNTILICDQLEYDLFWKAADDFKVPLYFYPRISSRLIHDQIWKGRTWLDFSSLRYEDLLNMNILCIITNRVVDRFSDVKLIFWSHG
jgi:2,3-dihydroxybenzoate decarboxylase